jgi:hypothetical protein
MTGLSGTLSVAICGDVSEPTETSGYGACEDAYITCVGEQPCIRWDVYAKQVGLCGVVVVIEGTEYPFEVEVVAHATPPHCLPKVVFWPVCGQSVFEIGPGCPPPICTAE